MSDFLANALKSIIQFFLPEFEALCDQIPDEFDTFQDVLKLYEGGIKLPDGRLHDKIKENILLEMLKQLVQTDGEGLSKFPKAPAPVYSYFSFFFFLFFFFFFFFMFWFFLFFFNVLAKSRAVHLVTFRLKS